MENFLVFEGISKSFGSIRVVENLDLSIHKGEVFSLLGPSGCGKTTLLRLCAGFESPDKGRILLNGRDISRTPSHKRPVNTVFQNYALFPHMTVRQNIAFGLNAEGISGQKCDKEVDRVLELIQMSDQGNKKPAALSGGQKQRVAIARAIVKKPELLLLDEPLAALDLKLRQKMLLELEGIHSETGITFLFVTHDQNEAMSLSDRIAVMNKGRIEQVGRPLEIYESPVSSFTAAFIGDTNFFDGSVKELSENGEYSQLEIEGLPDITCYNDRKHRKGDYIFLSVRPEKIRVSLTPFENDPDRNLMEGIIEEQAYLGAYTKYWIRCGEWLVVAQKSHRHYQLDRAYPVKGNKVYLNWHKDDGYMLLRYREKDEALLTNPDEEFAELKPDTQPGLLINNKEQDS